MFPYRSSNVAEQPGAGANGMCDRPTGCQLAGVSVGASPETRSRLDTLPGLDLKKWQGICALDRAVHSLGNRRGRDGTGDTAR